ncbi:SH protein [Almendravirus arboretum]|uniref:SH protein n=1 Tax=Almendravirus arboretum TaxID=1972683 RepID=X4QQM2_9RHAB|nr:SH protein [Almendravirus arboretum]AHU86499.1 SH protein [Almendravirus arboretum]
MDSLTILSIIEIFFLIVIIILLIYRIYIDKNYFKHWKSYIASMYSKLNNTINNQRYKKDDCHESDRLTVSKWV